MTQTANVAACPGKCIHALASLMCDTVLEEVRQKIDFFFDKTFDFTSSLQVQCPTSNMRCCVEKSGGGSPPNRDSSIPGLGLSMPPRWILFSQLVWFCLVWFASKVDLVFSARLVWSVCFLFDIPLWQKSFLNEILNRPSGSPPRKDESEEKEATTENVEEETTKKKKRRKKKDRTTTTTTPATTTKKETTTEETEVRLIFK